MELFVATQYYIYIYSFGRCFKSNPQCIQDMFYQYMHFPRIRLMTLVLWASCFNTYRKLKSLLQAFYNFVNAAGLSFTLLVKNWPGFNQLFRKTLLRLEWHVHAEIQRILIIVISGQKCLDHTVRWFLLWLKFRLGFKRLSVLSGSTPDADALCAAGPNVELPASFEITCSEHKKFIWIFR